MYYFDNTITRTQQGGVFKNYFKCNINLFTFITPTFSITAYDGDLNWIIFRSTFPIAPGAGCASRAI